MKPAVARAFTRGQCVEVHTYSTTSDKWCPAIVVGFSPGYTVVKVRCLQYVTVNGRRFWIRPRTAPFGGTLAIEARRCIRALPECVHALEVKPS